MANFSSTALLSQSDMQSILSAVKTYIDKQVELANGDTTAVANLLNALIGTSDKAAALENQKTVRAISAEEVAKIVANADTKYDTLKEIADWILSDTTGAAKMASDILQLQNYVGAPAEGETAATGLFKAIADEASRADAAEKANAKAISDEASRADAAEKANAKAISDEASRADAAEKANAKAISDEVTRATGVEEGLEGRIATLEGLFDGDNSVDAKIAAAQKAAEDHSDANLVTAKGYADTKKSEAISAAAEDATSKVNTLSGTAVSATHTDDGVTVTLGGTVGAPTVTVAVDMCTEAQLKDLTDLFAIA